VSSISNSYQIKLLLNLKSNPWLLDVACLLPAPRVSYLTRDGGVPAYVDVCAFLGVVAHSAPFAFADRAALQVPPPPPPLSLFSLARAAFSLSLLV
jgi:hypothetical protein